MSRSKIRAAQKNRIRTNHLTRSVVSSSTVVSNRHPRERWPWLSGNILRWHHHTLSDRTVLLAIQINYVLRIGIDETLLLGELLQVCRIEKLGLLQVEHHPLVHQSRLLLAQLFDLVARNGVIHHRK